MRKIREVLRLKFELDLSVRQISMSTQVSRPTVTDYLRRFAMSGLSWPLPAELADADIDARLNTADDQCLFAPVELKRLAQLELQRHKGMRQLAFTSPPITDEISDTAVATLITV